MVLVQGPYSIHFVTVGDSRSNVHFRTKKEVVIFKLESEHF